MSSRGLTLLIVTAALVAACGRKEPPKPPPSRIPAPLGDLTVQQRGMEILLRMSYPKTTLGGLPLENLEAIEIWEMRRIVTSFASTPDEGETEGAHDSAAADAGPAADAEPQDVMLAEDHAEKEEGLLLRLPTDVTELDEEEQPEDLIQVDVREFTRLATLRWTLRGAELDSAVMGDALVIRIPVEEIPAEEEILVLGARAVAGPRLASPFSKLVKLLLRDTPPAPTDLMVDAQPRGIEISWQSATTDKGFRVYRRDAGVRDYGPPIYSAPPEADHFLDTSARFGQRYIYAVTSVASTSPIVESAITAEREVDYRDRFPPSPPHDVVALPEAQRVRLLWEAPAEEDAVGYRVYRKDAGGEFRPITVEPVVGTEYLDRGLAAGQVYSYFVAAVDGNGNESEGSEEIEARVP